MSEKDSSSTFKELPLAAPGPKTRGPSSADPIVGIDLGTTNSLVAIVEENDKGERIPKIIPTLEGKNLLPSVVHFTRDGSPETGYVARAKKATDSRNTVYSVKRLLGKGAKDIPAGSVMNLDKSSESNVQIQAGGKTHTPIEISAMILRDLKLAAENYLGKAVEDAVITVPAYFNDSQRQATRAAGRLAGFNVLRILNEPTAASLAYGLEKKKNGLIAVYDLGGGTFDVSILKLKDGIFEVLATNGDTQLGGDDIDQIVAKWIGTKAKLVADKAVLLETAEKLKFQLSEKQTASLEVNEITISLSRSEFKGLVQPLLERSRAPVEQALSDAGLSKPDLTDVVLVGGPTRLEAVREFVRELFGRDPNTSMHPDEVVAAGAAIQADILAGNNKDFLLLDVVPLSLGIETFGGVMNKLIPRNTRIPTMAKEQFTTYVEGQTKVAINVFQGERELVKDNRKLAEFVLSGIPPLPAGVARVEVTFLVDADGILNVTAREIFSEITASIEVKPTYGISDTDVERMLEAGLANASADRVAAQLVEARNDAHTVLLATEKALTQMRGSLSKDEAVTIDRLVEELKTAIAGTSASAIKDAHAKLNEGTKHLAEELMHHTMQNELKNKKVKDVLKKA